MKEKIMILTADYKINKRGEPTIRLFGKNEDGKNILAYTSDFAPYFYLRAPTREDLTLLNNNSVVRGKKLERLKIGNKEEKFLKVYTKAPHDVRDLREMFKSMGREVYAADILFPLRFLYDVHCGLFVEVDGIERRPPLNYINIDKCIKIKSITSIESFKPKLKILSIDIETSLKTNRIYCIGLCYKNKENKMIKKYIDNDDENELLKKLNKIINKINPDIITGYNIYGFDLPKIIERMHYYNLQFALGRDGSEGVQRESQKVKDILMWMAPGRVVVDAWLMTKIEKRPQRETLDYVAEMFGLGKKANIDSTKLDILWKTRRDEIIEYCIRDAELALEILLKLKSIDKAIAMATIAKLPLEDCFLTKSTQLIDSILIPICTKKHIAVPCNKWSSEKTEKIKGGYVHETEAGLYNWVTVFDFKSMYPSIIINKNICFSDEKILPKIIKKLQNKRDKYKELSKEAGDYYDRLQDAIKILMNSFYGVFASDFYRFTNKEIGELITGTARENIKNIIKDMKQRGIPILYSDTDSVFCRLLDTNYRDTKHHAQQIIYRYSGFGYELELDRIFERFFTHGKKKRYVGLEVNDDGSKQIVMRGYETRRKDAFPYLQKTLEIVFNKILEGEPDEACKLATKRIKEIEKAPIEELVISKNIKKIEEYKFPERIAGIQAVKKLEALGIRHIPGTKVTWVITDGNKTPQEVEPYMPEIDERPMPDIDYYKNRLVKSLARIVDVFGWDEQALLTGLVQEKIIGGE